MSSVDPSGDELPATSPPAPAAAVLFEPLVERAARYAARAHRTQTRKGADLPYVTHLAGVVELLIRAGLTDPELLAAAWLHDCVEDTAVTFDTLAAEFPWGVVELVRELSERKDDLLGVRRPWRDRKSDHLAVIQQASLRGRALELADKLHNLSTMLYDLEAGAPVWSWFNAGPEEVLWYNREMISAADQGETELQPLAAACRAAWQQLRDRVSPTDPLAHAGTL